MDRKGLEMAFNMIFSIIIIIAIVGMAIYAIVFFLNFNKCASVAQFFLNFEDKVESQWLQTNSFFDEEVSYPLPSSVDEVCFWDADPVNLPDEYIEKLSSLRFSDSNVFLVPIDSSCLIHYQVKSKGGTPLLDLSDVQNFHCEPVIKGKVTIHLKKDISDALIKIVP